MVNDEPLFEEGSDVAVLAHVLSGEVGTSRNVGLRGGAKPEDQRSPRPPRSAAKRMASRTRPAEGLAGRLPRDKDHGQPRAANSIGLSSGERLVVVLRERVSPATPEWYRRTAA